MKKRRAYDRTLRTKMAAENEARILMEAERLFSTQAFDRVTLAAVAEAAGVTIPTLQRRFGNKEGLVAAWGAIIAARMEAQRGTPPVGSVGACIRELVDQYEREGALMWHLLRQESDVPLLQGLLARGRAKHRQWVKTVFSEAIAHLDARKRRARVDALVAVTDVFVWKLLRIDLRRGRAEVEALVNTMAESLARRA